MKRFTFKGVLENFRQSVSQPTKSEQPDLIETLKSEHCQLARVSIVNLFLYSSFCLCFLRLLCLTKFVSSFSVIPMGIYPSLRQTLSSAGRKRRMNNR